MSNNKKFYITTAIAYTSRKPHIGNAYDIVLADMIARYKKMQGYDVFLMTGSDEHGQKIEEYANAAGISPKEYVDGISGQIKEVWQSLNTDYDKFIRTTDADHEAAVQKIFTKLYEQGDIYKGHYEGKYCVPCESFFTPSQLVDGKCPDCGREVIDSKEEAYFLRLSKYQDKLLEYYEQNPDFIMPESRKNEMINNFLKPGLSDLCVSRSTFKWGIPVEFDPKHVTYVWIDALSNYITGIGYNPDGSTEQFEALWPADLHVIGKDIVRFHTIYWPIILMALGLPLPKQVLGHPWVLVGEDKMSKSKGNVIYADELAKRFSTDAVRYYLLSEIPFAQDGTITYESFINKFNSDLANTLGNLVNRSVAMTNKYFDGKVSFKECDNEFDKDLIATAKEAIEKYHSLMDIYRNADAVNAVMNLAKRCNKYIDETTPWSLAKDEAQKDRLEAVLYNLLECIRLLGIMLTPIMPESCDSIKAQLNETNGELCFGTVKEYSVGTATPLFARIDAEKVLAEIAAEQEAAKKAAEAAANVATIAEIGIEDFAKVELCAAKIVACEAVPKAKKLLKLTLNDGKRDRTVASGIAKFYKPEELVGKTVILVSNLKKAKLCGIESEGMILAADCSDDNIKVIFLEDIPAGSKIR
ncbi:MAG: methionine--tRNA ligase [Ruminococcaceae bacterium]|nr:methionine--tRNA ligase [Oscillospiraceae bacterium]